MEIDHFVETVNLDLLRNRSSNITWEIEILTVC